MEVFELSIARRILIAIAIVKWDDFVIPVVVDGLH